MNNYLDEVQYNMLGLVISIMNNYHLNIDHISNQLSYQQPPNYENNLIQPMEEETEFVPINKSKPIDIVQAETKTSFVKMTNYAKAWGDSDSEDEVILSSKERPKNKKMFVSHRRAFRDALSNGNRICSQYNNCTDNNCKRFHVLDENLCPHAGRNNYCEDANCDKIVIKACRKGKRCNDKTCSFRH